MPFESPPLSDVALLIGAGFSRNWGGRLAREMWEDIFSHRAVQARPALRALMLRTPMFEDVLTELVEATYHDDDRAAMNVAIKDAFDRMDSEHSAQFASARNAIDLGGMREFISRFISSTNRVGYVFSLNQDVLFERIVSHFPEIQVTRPGVRGLPWPDAPNGLPNLAYPATPDPRNARLGTGLNYCKLHGSFTWRPEDGSPGMILGGAKQIDIGRSPLLIDYHDLFQRVLSAGHVRLLIIGYSFGDIHINKAIVRAVHANNAKIFVWDTASPLDLVAAIRHDPVQPSATFDLRPYLCGAASRPLSVVMPWGEHPTPEFKRIVGSFFI